MDYDDLLDAIDGLHAWDGGAVDSGIRDEALRQRVIDHVRALSADERRWLLSRAMRDLCLTDDRIDQGYGWEDALDLAHWMRDNFGGA